MTSNNASFTATFANLDIETSSAKGIVTTGNGALNITTGTLDTTGHTGIELNGLTTGITFTTITVNTSGASNEAIDIDSLGSGSSVASSTTTLCATGACLTGIDIDNSTGTFIPLSFLDKPRYF